MRRRAPVSLLVAGWLAVLATTAAARVEVTLTAPAQLSPGETIDVPVSIRDGDEDVATYAFRLLYDPSVVRVVEVRGGTFEGFAEPPVTNPASFATGVVDFTANNRGFLATPESFIAATIRLEAVGEPGQSSLLRLRAMPNNQVAISRTFRRVSTRFSGARAVVAIR